MGLYYIAMARKKPPDKKKADDYSKSLSNYKTIKPFNI